VTLIKFSNLFDIFHHILIFTKPGPYKWKCQFILHVTHVNYCIIVEDLWNDIERVFYFYFKNI